MGEVDKKYSDGVKEIVEESALNIHGNGRQARNRSNWKLILFKEGKRRFVNM